MTTRVPLSQGLFALVDDEDAERVLARRWCASRGKTSQFYGYYPKRRSTPAVLLHRFVLGESCPESVDHINGNTLDCRKSNLRAADKSQNGCNRGKQRNNTSGYKGVYWHDTGKKWYSRIQARGVDRHLGMYADPQDAARAYDKAARELHGEFAKVNFP